MIFSAYKLARALRASFLMLRIAFYAAIYIGLGLLLSLIF